MASSDQLDALEAAITQKPPFCTGTVPITPVDATLFYRQGTTSNLIDLSGARENDLQTLAQACEPATFGVNQEDVLDESYRKAGKMDSENFATKFDVGSSGIVDRVRGQLLEGDDMEKVVVAELYKLNVYGKDSFFKSHKDTPRSDTMFGSLVIVFPTPHDGGALVLRHSGQEWTFDSANLTREQAEPSVAYIAFYSDVDHEVTAVKSGYRVTLTYNLFLDKKRRQNLPASITPVAPDENHFKDAMATALADPSFLPEGGYLGFGLSFKYPTYKIGGPAAAAALKGSDAVIYRVYRQSSLDTSSHAVYEENDVSVLVPSYHSLSNMQYEDGIIQGLCNENDGKVIHEFGDAPPYDKYGSEYEDTIRLAWVTPLTAYNNFSSSYVAYGNEATSACIYGDYCIAVEVGLFGGRETA